MRVTRAQRARELFEMLDRGPSSLKREGLSISDYRIWVNTWVLPELKHLIPELRDNKGRKK